MTIVAIASIRFGFHLGIAAEARRWTNEAQKEFKEQYFSAFAKKFEERVNEKSDELAAEKIAIFIDNLPEEQQKWFISMIKENEDDVQTGT